MSMETLSETTGIPVKRLRTVVLHGDDTGRGLLIGDIYRLALALGVKDTFADWFRELMDVAAG